MRSYISKGVAVATLALSIPIFCSGNTFADATNIDVSTPAGWYDALQTIHASSNSEFIINLGANIEINDSAVVNNQAIDNGNTVKYVTVSYKYQDSLMGSTYAAIPVGDMAAMVEMRLEDENYEPIVPTG